ncbi:thioredoxin [Candidatus Kryptobacter tengchongensis]|uniref:thioredoxin TrxA n=1 Tax=Kryptobacter tengchongensis TaxID=1643429 RepID=UPI000707A273|nr:thioredoxin TrxA [Candidatus Kryptobacter tengchongensis]CUS80618.1 thioredoxin [Candidatus Kryptobacter tengchongensis]CUS96292.1 thioredoxin [Candidatus Kryptobacter tengchongensis]CUU05802.1 thioredoxin [Candidatus Kryptobacter tengchongensis]CUU09369.1 thioredoxin [Candidatus Kryptobacter tengchongensis]
MSKNIIELTDLNFEDEVLKSDKLVLVDFWAEWCAPCRMIAPIIEEIANEYADRLKVGKLNVDYNPKTAMKYGIMSIPTLLLFQNGRVIEQIVGAMPKKNLLAKLEKYLLPV